MKKATDTVQIPVAGVDKPIWGLFYVDIAENRFVETLYGVSTDQSKLIKYATDREDFTLNPHFDAAKGNYRFNLKDYYGVRTRIFTNFPFLIKKVNEIT
jgi:hypothetical protein